MSVTIEGIILNQETMDIIHEVLHETSRAQQKWPPYNSAHEGFGVLLEEVDELKEHVWKNQKNRDLASMQKEAIQVAAVAIRFAVDVCTDERGRN